MNASRALARIARREMLRARGRSTLIVLMIAAPIAVMTFADVTLHMSNLTTTERVRQKTGAADVRLHWTMLPEIRQNARGDSVPVGDPNPTSIAAVEAPDIVTMAEVEPSRVIIDERVPVRVRSGRGVAISELRLLEYTNPIARGLVKQVSGRAPRSANEVVLTKSAKKRFGADLNDQIDIVTDGASSKVTVVGTAEVPDRLNDNIIIGLSGTIPPLSSNAERYYLVDLERPIAWEHVQEFNKVGVVVSAVSLAADPPAGSEFESIDDEGTTWSGVAVVVLFVGLAMMEICLLAGAAFAVGVRRQRRSLALLSAAGGTSQQVRNAVLLMAVFLGLTASIIGVAIGVGASFLARSWLEELQGARFARFDVRMTDVAVIVALGLTAAVLASLLPARWVARTNVIAALNGRPEMRSSKRTWKAPLLGAILVVAGVSLAMWGSNNVDMNTVLVGAIFCEVGLILFVSLLVELIGRSARWLPLGPRLALRDAVRNRQRTVPVVAAVMAAVAGSFAVAMYQSTNELDGRETYQASVTKGNVVVALGSDHVEQVNAVTSALRNIMPIERIGAQSWVEMPGCEPSAHGMGGCVLSIYVERIGENACPALTRDGVDSQLAKRHYTDPRCRHNGDTFASPTGVVVGDSNLAHVMFGSRGSEAAQTLESGVALVASEYDLHNGVSRLSISTEMDGETVKTRTVDLPAMFFEAPEGTSQPPMIISRAIAKSLGLEAAAPNQLVAGTTRMPTQHEEDRLREVIDRNGMLTDVRVERGYQHPPKSGTLAVTAAVGLLVLMATAIAVGLSLADGQRDQSTLGAIGASPRIRRFTSAFQAFVVAAMGVGLGMLAGLLPGVAVTWVSRYVEIAPGVTVHSGVPWMEVIPWISVVLLMIVVPLLGAGLAALFTSSQPSTTRRAS